MGQSKDVRFIRNASMEAAVRSRVPMMAGAEVKVYVSERDENVRVIETVEDHGSNGQWRHCSISRADRYPTWAEIVQVRTRFFLDSDYVVQILPPSGEYVNVHPNCFHLWARLDQPTIPPDLVSGL